MSREFIDGIPTVFVTLDKPREIGFTLGALRRVFEKLGSLDFDMGGPKSSLALATYLWACLPASGRAELSVEGIEDMIHPGNIEAITDAVGALLKRSQPDDDAVNPTTPASAPAASN